MGIKHPIAQAITAKTAALHQKARALTRIVLCCCWNRRIEKLFGVGLLTYIIQHLFKFYILTRTLKGFILLSCSWNWSPKEDGLFVAFKNSNNHQITIMVYWSEASVDLTLGIHWPVDRQIPQTRWHFCRFQGCTLVHLSTTFQTSCLTGVEPRMSLKLIFLKAGHADHSEALFSLSTVVKKSFCFGFFFQLHPEQSNRFGNTRATLQILI